MEITLWDHIVQNPTQIVTWLIFCIGIVLSILNRKQDTKKFALTLLAFTILLIDAIGSAVFFIWTVNLDSMVQLVQQQEAFSCITTPFWIAAWIMLLMALFQQNPGSNETT